MRAPPAAALGPLGAQASCCPLSWWPLTPLHSPSFSRRARPKAAQRGRDDVCASSSPLFPNARTPLRSWYRTPLRRNRRGSQGQQLSMCVTSATVCTRARMSMHVCVGVGMCVHTQELLVTLRLDKHRACPRLRATLGHAGLPQTSWEAVANCPT